MNKYKKLTSLWLACVLCTTFLCPTSVWADETVPQPTPDAVVEQAPDVAPTAPDVAPTAPDVAPTVPDVAPTVPDVVPTVPDIMPNIVPSEHTNIVEEPVPYTTGTPVTVTTAAELKMNLEAGNDVILGGDVTVEEGIFLYQDVSLSLAGHTLTMMDSIFELKNGDLRICTTEGNAGTILCPTDGTYFRGAGQACLTIDAGVTINFAGATMKGYPISLGDASTFILNEGATIENAKRQESRIISLISTGNHVINGTVRNCVPLNNGYLGGAVKLDNSAASLTVGSTANITSNQAECGGVHAANGTLIVEAGATITGNIDKNGNPLDVYLDENCQSTISGSANIGAIYMDATTSKPNPSTQITGAFTNGFALTLPAPTASLSPVATIKLDLAYLVSQADADKITVYPENAYEKTIDIANNTIVISLPAITYDANGATGAANIPSKETVSSTSYTVSATMPTVTGKTFVGWNTMADGTGTTYYPGATIANPTTCTLYAQWMNGEYAEPTLIVNVGANSYRGSGGALEQVLTEGGAISKIEITAYGGYVFPFFEDKYSSITINGLTVERSYRKDGITVSGTPTAFITTVINLPDAITPINAETPVVPSLPDATYEQGDTIAALDATTTVSDGGTVTYQWRGMAVPNGSSYYPPTLEGETSATHTPDTPKVGEYVYQVQVTNTLADNGDGGTKTATNENFDSNDARITISPKAPTFSTNLSTEAVTYELDATATALTVATAALGDGIDGTVSYQWQKSTNGETWSDIAGATGTTYTPSTSLAEVGTIYYRASAVNTVAGADCASTGYSDKLSKVVTSNVATISVTPPTLSFKTDLQETEIIYIKGDKADSLKVEANRIEGNSYTIFYDWYKSSDKNADKDTWEKVGTGSGYKPDISALGTTYYYVKASLYIANNVSATGISKIATVTVNEMQTPTFKVDLSTEEVVYVYNATPNPLTVEVNPITDGGRAQYYWEYSEDGENWNYISDQYTATYTPDTSSAGTTYYRAKAQNYHSFGSTYGYSKVAKITVNEQVNAETPVVPSLPGATYEQGDTATALDATATVGDGGTLTYQWDKCEKPYAGMLYFDQIDGATSATYTPETTQVGTYKYRVWVKNTIENNGDGGGKSAGADVTSLSIYVTPKTPVFSTNLSTEMVTYYYGETPTDLTVATEALGVGIDGTVSYQWQKSTNGTTWSDIAGETGTTYTPQTNTAGTAYYRVQTVNTVASEDVAGEGYPDQTSTVVTSNVATIKVNEQVNAKAPVFTYGALRDATYQYNATSSVLNGTATVSDGGTVTYTWFSSTDSKTWSLIENATAATYTPSTSTVGVMYYMLHAQNTIANNGDGGTKTAVNQTIAKVTVNKATAPSITFPTASDLTYGDTLADSTLTGTSVYGTFAWTTGTTVPTVTNNGYEVTFTPSADTLKNYEAITPLTANVAVTVAKATNTVSLTMADCTYGGTQSTPVASATFTDTTYPITYTYSTSETGTFTSTVPTDAGTYYVKADVAESDNYTSGTKTVSYKIAKATAPSITFPTASDLTYGDTLADSTLTGTSVYGTFAWTDDTTVPTVTNSGYEVTFTPSADTLKNYEAITPLTANVAVTVAKKDATVVIDDDEIVRGMDLPTVTSTVTGTITGETIVPEYTALTDNMTAGTYTITMTNVDDYPNYDITVTDGTLTIKDGYTVSIDGVETTDVAHGTMLMQPQDPTKTDYIFRGWYAGEDEFDFDKPITADVTITSKWEKAVERKVETAGDTPVTIGDDDADTLKDTAFTPEEINANKEMKITVKVDTVVTEEVDTDLQTRVDDYLATQNDALSASGYAAKQAVVFDISVIKTVDGVDSLLTQLAQPITITIEIPEQYQSENRAFFILRDHNGALTKLADLDTNPATMTFLTDRFSSYVLNFTEPLPTSNSSSVPLSPSTGADATTAKTFAVWSAMALIILLMATACNEIRKRIFTK